MDDRFVGVCVLKAALARVPSVCGVGRPASQPKRQDSQHAAAWGVLRPAGVVANGPHKPSLADSDAMKTAKTLCRHVIGAACFFAAFAVNAEIVKFDYSGRIRHIAYFGGFHDSFGYAEGQIVSGTFVVDLNVPDTDTSTLRAFRPLSIAEMVFGRFGTNSLDASYTYFSITADPIHDHISAFAQRQTGAYIDTFEFSLESSGATRVLGSDSPDLSALRLTDFDPSDSRFSLTRVLWPVSSTLQAVQITAQFDALTAAPLHVPEPGSLVLVSSGILLWSSCRRGRQQMFGSKKARIPRTIAI